MILVLGWSAEVDAADREVTMGRFFLPPPPLGLPKAYYSLPDQNLTRLIKQSFNVTLNRDAVVGYGGGHLGLVAKPLFGNVNGALHSPALANWVTQLMNKMEVWLTNRTHMIQFCAIGMVLALVIIWWRKT